MIQLFRTIFFMILSWSFLSPILAQDLLLLKPTGIYAVGTKTIEIKDPDRQMLRGSSQRRWVVQAFYPAQSSPNDKNGATYPYRPGTLQEGIVERVKVFSYAKPDAVPAKHQRFPVIFFVPGMGGERQGYTILCEELASQGYVVLSLDQPYFSNFVKFPDSTTIVLTFKDAWKIRDRDYKYAYYDEAMAAAMGDIKYMLDHLDEIDIKNLGGVLDKNIPILMGHSFGGNVSHTLGFEDSRIRAIVDIDSKITERKIFGRIGVPPNPQEKPVLFIRAMMQYQEDVGDQLTKITNATIWSPSVQHSAFSDQAYLAAHIAGFGDHGFLYRFFNWFFKQGPHFDNVDTNLGGKDVDAWFMEYRHYIVTWLDKHLK